MQNPPYIHRICAAVAIYYAAAEIKKNVIENREQGIQLQRSLLSPMDRWVERANREQRFQILRLL